MTPTKKTVTRFPVLTLSVALVLVALLGCGTATLIEPLSTLLLWGANNPTLIIEEGQWWRLLTANFLHVSWWHLAWNLLLFIVLGTLAERRYNRAAIVVLLFGSGLSTTLLSTLATHEISSGASGLVFGLWGALGAEEWYGNASQSNQLWRRSISFAFLPLAFVGVFLSFLAPNVDPWGHLGGLCWGLFFAIVYPTRSFGRSKRLQYAILFSLTVLLIASASGLRWGTQGGPLEYHPAVRQHAIQVPTPKHWPLVARHKTPSHQTATIANPLDVRIATDSRPVSPQENLQTSIHNFIHNELAHELERINLDTVRITPAQPTTLDNHQAMQVTVYSAGTLHPMISHYTLCLAHSLRHIVSVSYPSWLAAEYKKLHHQLLAGVRIQSSANTLSRKSTPMGQ